MGKRRSQIQLTAEEIFLAANESMHLVMQEEKIHGKCFNYRREINTDVWIFEDKYELKVQRIA